MPIESKSQTPSHFQHGLPDFVPSVVIGSGKPTLVVPAGYSSRPFKHVTVTWTPTRQSARAVEAALHFLGEAEHVDAVTWDEDHSAENSLPQLVGYLSHRGVTATPDKRGKPIADVGHELLQLVRDNSSDLLVMGCYGHSRLRELVLGGATRSVLKHMTVPVLMAH